MVLGEFIKVAVKVFHGYFIDNLLFRAEQGIDTSLERVKARRESRIARVTFANQTDTVHVAYRGSLAGRTVVVFDDFTTTGRSLEWARNLLYAAGAERVVLVTIGKYSGPYMIHAPTPTAGIEPFRLKRYPTSQCFTTMHRNLSAAEIIKRSFNAWKTNQPL
jgi:hypoxanthine phosphoribosyltransferase